MSDCGRPELAVILAAGRGTRLRPLTHEVPKPLLRVGGRSILDQQVGALRRNGIDQLLLVTGFQAEKIRAAAPAGTRFVHNPEYATTNNLHSLWVTREEIAGRSFLCLHGDLLFHPGILERCLEETGDVVMAVDRELADETMRVTRSGKGRGKLEIRKGVPADQAEGTFIGMALFSAAAASRLVAVLEQLVTLPESATAYFTRGIEVLAAEGMRMVLAATGGQPWIEIDDEHDLGRAATEVWPALMAALDDTARRA